MTRVTSVLENMSN